MIIARGVIEVRVLMMDLFNYSYESFPQLFCSFKGWLRFKASLGWEFSTASTSRNRRQLCHCCKAALIFDVTDIWYAYGRISEAVSCVNNPIPPLQKTVPIR